MQFINKSYYYYISVFSIIIISFLFYSSNFCPSLCSDDAINILMAHYYKLPYDLYYWGQDRAGSLIPFISQFFIKIFHLSALTSVSLSNYLIMIIGFFSFSSLFKTTYSKILFAIIWFLPFEVFILILRYPFGIEYSLIAFAIFLINKLENKDPFNSFKNNLLLAVIVIILILSVWVSDLAIVTIGVLLFVLLISNYLKKETIIINKTVLYYFVFGSIACFMFIKFAKTFAVDKTEHYLSINNFEEIKTAILLLKKSFIVILTFKTKEIFISIYSYCVIIFLITLIIFVLRKKILLSLFSNKWFSFFILDFIAIFISFLLSSWILANRMGYWYFVASYISISMVILLAVEHLQINKYPIKLFKLALIFIVFIGTISSFYTMKYVSPKTLRPKVDVVGEFKQLGKIGIIANYWNSYIASCPDPEMIKATPNDQDGVRNQEIVDMVFERKNLYVIKDCWLEIFPDTLEQFGYVLLKDGNEFRLGECNVCKYNKMKLQKVITLNELKFNESQIIFDKSLNKNILFVSTDCNTCKENTFIYGPYIPIGIGNFTVRFYMKATKFKNDYPFAVLDVAADFGTTQFIVKKISKSDFNGNNYKYIDLDFSTKKRYNNVEFRIYYYGNADIYFDHIELKEK